VPPSGKLANGRISCCEDNIKCEDNTVFHDVGHSVKILHSFTSACAPNEMIESFGLRGMSMLMEERMRINRCFVTPETARRILDIFRYDLLRFNIEDLDENDETEVEYDVKAKEEEKKNVQMIVQEIRRAIGA
jgi:hypothetical protein